MAGSRRPWREDILWGTMILLVPHEDCRHVLHHQFPGGAVESSVPLSHRGHAGGRLGFLGHQLAPGWVINPSSFVLVGIGGFFAGVAKVPVASIIWPAKCAPATPC